MSIENELDKNLFQMALKEAIDKNNLWLQIRVFEELEMDSELDELLCVFANRKHLPRSFVAVVLQSQVLIWCSIK
jgi:hypothetical protein